MSKFAQQGGVPANYVLGRGRLYLKGELGKYVSGTHGSDTDAWRDIGNVTAFTLSYERETKDHTSYLLGAQTIDLSIAVSTKMNVSFTLDELSIQNLAMFLGGYTISSSAGGSVINPAKINSDNAAFVGNENMFFTVPALATNYFFDLWRDMELTFTSTSTVYRAYDFEAEASQSITVRKNPTDRTTADGTLLVEGTHYEIDRKAGLIKFLTGSVVGGDTIQIKWAAGTSGLSGIDTSLHYLTLLETSGKTVAVKFVQENANDEDKYAELTLHSVKLQPDGDFAGIGDDWATLSFTGVAQAISENIPIGSSPYGKLVMRETYST